MTTGKTIALSRWTFVGNVMSLLFNMLSKMVIPFLPRRKCLLFIYLFFKYQLVKTFYNDGQSIGVSASA